MPLRGPVTFFVRVWAIHIGRWRSARDFSRNRRYPDNNRAGSSIHPCASILITFVPSSLACALTIHQVGFTL
jgi:hypothetical protein